MSAAGFAAAIAAAVFNGSFAALAKLPAVRRSDIDPVFFSFLCCCGVALSSAAVIPLLQSAGVPVALSLFGALAGGLFVFASLFSFVAVPLVGLSVAQGVWGGTAIFVAFAWGALGPPAVRAPLGSVPLSALALALLLAGVAGISFNGEIAAALGRPRRSLSLLDEVLSDGLAHGTQTQEGAGAGVEGEWADGAPAAPPAESARWAQGRAAAPAGGASAPLSAWGRRVAGTASALLVGGFGGSVLVPSKFVPPELSGFGVLPSFGLGALVAGSLVAAAYAGARACRGQPLAHGMPGALPAGVASGVVWNAGNACAIYAMSPAGGGLNYGVAYPIVQCALLVSGLLGICAFGEIKERGAIVVFFGAAAVLVAGGAVLGFAGPSGAGAEPGGAPSAADG